MKLPPKNTIVPLKDVLKLCDDYGLYNLKQKIINNPPPKPFKSDGASGCPAWLSRWIYKAAFLHDLKYWMGGTKEERLQADREFEMDLIKYHGLHLSVAKGFYLAVRGGGTKYLPTSWRWGFGWE